MAIRPKCDMCGNELVEFGGILLSPPSQDSKVVKSHLCVDCYQEIADKLKNLN